MDEQIAQRIGKSLGVCDLIDLLSTKLSGSELHSVLLAVLKRRIRKIEPSNLTKPNALSSPCDLDARLLNWLESMAYETAVSFEAIELSSVAPLGSVAVLTGLDQANVLSTVRAFECASDPTIGLALECARRRSKPAHRKEVTRLCTNQRVVRFPLPETPGFTAHFKLFSLVTAGRDSGSFTFETSALAEQIGTYLSLLSKLSTHDFEFSDTVVQISDTRAVAHLCSMFKIDRDEIRTLVRARDSQSATKLLEKYSVAWPKSVTKPAEELAAYDLPKHLIQHLSLIDETVCTPLATEHTNVRFEFNMHRLTGLGYYDGPCFHVKTKNRHGQEFALADGGFVRWTQASLGDVKERLLTSAIGTELMCRLFRG